METLETAKVIEPVSNEDNGFHFPTRKLVLPLILYKLFLLWLVLAGARLLPESFNVSAYDQNFHWPEKERPNLRSYFKTWDAHHYLYLSEAGYRNYSASTAFFPLWPASIRLVAAATGMDRLAVGLVLANLFSLVAMLIFHSIVSKTFGTRVGCYALLLLLAFPGALFLSFMYSESLVFLLLMVLFYCSQHRLVWGTAAAGFLISTATPFGVLCSVPLLIECVRGKSWSRVAYMVLPIILGFVAYLGYMKYSAGSPWIGFRMHGNFLSQGSFAKFLDIPGFVSSFFIPLQLHGLLDSALDRMFFILFVTSLFLIFRINKTLFAYAIVFGLLTAIFNSLVGYTRFLTLAFPLFIAGAVFFQAAEKRIWFPLVLGCLFAVQVVFLLRFTNNYWVG